MDEREIKAGGFSAPFMGRILHGPDPGEMAGAGNGGGTTTDDDPTDAAPLDKSANPSGDTEPSAPSVSGPSPGGTMTPADPNIAAGSTRQPTEAQDGWQSIREAARGLGYQMPQDFQDDRTFLLHLLGAAQQNRQADFYARLGQQLAPHAQGIQDYLQQRQQPAQPQRQPWEAPEIDDRWFALVERDQATGMFFAKPGVPAEIAAKVNAFAEWKAKYDRNPAAAINGMVDTRAKEIAAQIVREQLAEQTRQQTIGQIVTENTSWLYQRDQAGHILSGVNGPLYTPVGARYVQHLQSVRQMGVTDPRAQDRLAKALVQGELYAAQQQGQQQAGATVGNPQTQQAGHRPNINPLQTQPPVQRRKNPAATEPSGEGKSLAEMLREDFAAQGVTDADFANNGG